MTTSPEGIHLLGAEMLTWSDLHGEAGAFGGQLGPHLLKGFTGEARRVLVAGPVTPTVAAGVASRFAHADVLVRSWPDAQEMRTALPDSIGIHCGPLDRLPVPDEGYDTVVAVAGIDRLHSAEEQTPAWVEVLDHLARLVGEQGELYVAVDNPIGVDRLVALDPVNRHHDAAWPQGRAGVHSPRDREEVVRHLGDDHGLQVAGTWVCHGPRNDPRTACEESVLTRLRTEAVLLRAVEGAYTTASSSVGQLRDPGHAARDLVEAGLGAATAPMSILHLRRGVSSEPAPGGPVLLVREASSVDASPLSFRLEHDGSAWRRALLGSDAPVTVTPDLTREPARLVGPVRPGSVLGDRMRDLLAEHDESSAAELVRVVRDWIGEDPVDPRRVPLLLDHLVVENGEPWVLDDSYVAGRTAPREVVLLRVLLRFAHDLLARGARHPWSPASTARSVAESLAAAAGWEPDAEVFAQAVELDSVLADPVLPVPLFEAAAGDISAIATMPYADLVELSQGLAVRAAEQEAHVRWLLENIQARQRRLRRARGTNHRLVNSREYRVGRRIFWIRDLRRRWRAKREEKLRPAGHWRAAPVPEPVEDRWLEVESDLVPPGYEPHGDVVIVPPADETEQPEKH